MNRLLPTAHALIKKKLAKNIGKKQLLAENIG